MSAAELRKAAETLRTLSAASSRAPWAVDGEDDLAGTEVRAARGAGPTVATTVPLGYERRRANAAYIATMGPDVGDLLASLLSMASDHAQGRGAACDSCVEYFVDVARLINGGE